VPDAAWNGATTLAVYCSWKMPEYDMRTICPPPWAVAGKAAVAKPATPSIAPIQLVMRSPQYHLLGRILVSVALGEQDGNPRYRCQKVIFDAKQAKF
jgi:hypothetical protein